MEISALPKILTTIGLALVLTACGSGSDGDSGVVVSYGDDIFVENDLLYKLPLVVLVSDSNGAPRANTKVTIELTAIFYYKGWYEHKDTDTSPDGITDKWVKEANLECAAEEDTNNNGILDPFSEDVNLNGLKEPDLPLISDHPTLFPTLISGTPTLLTSDNGVGYFALSYPKTEASWVKVRVTASIDGSPTNRDFKEFSLLVALADLVPVDDPPAFEFSPYGIDLDCTSIF